MAVQFQFKKAVKLDARGRVALIGPGGSGKSMTSLRLARLLAGPDGKIAAIDTEHGSLSKYAVTDGEKADNLSTFEFDVIELDSFTTDNFLGALKAAEDSGYAVFVCDSLSHFWAGKDGALEFVDMASKRNRDQMAGWKDFRPHERKMIDAMIASPCHVICTMRTKNEYVEVEENGKKKRKKIGLAPVQRDGLEYEFDLVAYMDDENTFITEKTRCSSYARKAIVQPTAQDFEPFRDWLKGVKAQEVAAQPQAAPQSKPAQPQSVKPTSGQLMKQIAAVRAEIVEQFGDAGTTRYKRVAANIGVHSTKDINTLAKAEQLLEALKLAQADLRENGVAPEDEPCSNTNAA